MMLTWLRTIVRGHVQSVKHKQLTRKAGSDSTCGGKIFSSR